MPKKKIIILLIFFIILACLIVFIFFKYFFSIKKVVVGPKWVNQAQFAGLFTAKEKGFYFRKGLDVSFKEFTPETDLIKDLVEGKTDFAITSAEEYLTVRDKGNDLVAIAVFYQTSPYTMVSLKDSGIKSAADFQGKILGSKSSGTGGAEEDLVYEILLNSVGLTFQDTTLKKIGFSNQEIDYLLTKTVDVIDIYRTDQLYFFDKNKVEYNIIYPEQYGLGLFNDVLVTRKDLIVNNPKLVSDFVTASIDGWNSAIKNPNDAIKYTLKHVTKESYQDIDYETYILKESIPLIKPHPTSRIGLMQYSSWERIYLQMKNRGFVKNVFSINDLFTNEFIP